MHFLNVELEIIHRDLKSANIYLYQNHQGIRVKIANFGWALHALSNDEDSVHQEIGTIEFRVCNKKL
jgi:serine/threonine protein kinase